MDLLLLIISAMGTFAYCYMTALNARRMDACQEPDYCDEIDQYRGGTFLDHWAAIYQTNAVLRQVEFQVFILNPRGHLAALVWRTDELTAVEDMDPAPLLPMQVFAADRLDRQHAQEDKALRTLERRYQQISNSSGQLYSPAQTRGTHLKPV